MAKYKVTLTEEERAELKTLIKTGKAAARKLNHARILLLSDEGPEGSGKTDSEIAEALDTGTRTIERVRKQFVTEGLEQAINPKPRPKRPDKVKIKGEIEEHLVELACSVPPEGRTRWTLHLLTDELVVLTSLDSLSTETVRKALKKKTLTLQP
ncbi:MAG: helix-turn-helix domain-containing protein [Caldilineaceae bacterium]|nr:helix-turn-helix domain-containing protein [Caldilineaceae bacterium]